ANRRIHEAENQVVIVMKMANEPAPKIRTVAPHVSETMARVIDRALEFRREDRYPDADAMRAEVEEALARLWPGEAKTELAMAPPLAVEDRNRDTTMHLSSGDLEPAFTPAMGGAFEPNAEAKPEPEPPPAPPPEPATVRAREAEPAAPPPPSVPPTDAPK